MKKKIIIAITTVLLNLFVAKSALAVCPVCVIAVSSCLGLSRWLGVDDSATGVWIGGLIVSLAILTVNWLRKKQINFKGDMAVIILAYYILTILPLYFLGLIGHPLNKIWGIDKLVAGSIIGGAIFYLTEDFYEYLKKRNNGKAYFPYQKVAMPLASLLAASIIFYYLSKLFC